MKAEIARLFEELSALRLSIVEGDSVDHDPDNRIHPRFRESAHNLRHYIRFRQHDLRELQGRLAALGLSSLGRAESHVLATIDAVLAILRELLPDKPLTAGGTATLASAAVDAVAGRRLLDEHTATLLGPAAEGRRVHIMVTMPAEAAHDYTLVRDLVREGMDCMRINCAHDDADSWRRMIEHLRRAEREVGCACKVVMDLAGPKLRTGPVSPGASVIRLHPQRDDFGSVTAPARVWITSDSAPRQPPSPADGCLPVSESWIAGLCVGDRIEFTDARGAKRTMHIADVLPGGAWAEMATTAYLTPATMLTIRRTGRGSGRPRTTMIAALPPREGSLRLHRGDLLMLTKALTAGRPPTFDSSGHLLTPGTIGCTMPEIFRDLRAGDPIWFDDGKIGGVVEGTPTDHALVRITHARMIGTKLGADKGINLPETALRVSALTTQDLADLAFAAEYADVIELSFAASASDVESLQQHIRALGKRQPGIVLKIETRRGFECLPEMLFALMRWPCIGLMIARGDLAVECGFERLAEVQEEILWFCEAAHVPVIWATQVLETLAKEGLPSRAEITDAAMGNRAECVMLNKGPHILRAVRVLDDILRRMEAHQSKKSAMLRQLSVAREY